ncbi:MAG: TIGR03905 family TSCPD domain-containing protein [Lachnospiraceae bacterium]
MEYRPSGVCSQMIEFNLDEDIVKSVVFTGGCSGNLQGIGRLVEGMNVDEAIARMEGIRCGNKNTSCPDQFAKALRAAKKNK